MAQSVKVCPKLVSCCLCFAYSRCVSLFLFLLFSVGLAPCFAQESEIGRKIYTDNAQSVLLLYAQDPGGVFVAQGSGFVIEGQRIVTNAHVANAGKIFVDLGPARVPARVEKIDGFNDLAILRVDVQLTVKPLKCLHGIVATGMSVYAIGNPEGLEKSISQGVVSGQRDIDGHRLLQITAAISHGSSGGPIFNSSGEVIGVAVAILSSGQNLNFAVPISLVERTISGSDLIDSTNALATIGQVQKLAEFQDQQSYSQEPDSPWQTTQNQISPLLERAYGEAGTNSESLLRVSEEASKQGQFDLAIRAAERAVESKPSAGAQIDLAKALDIKGIWTQGDDQKKLFGRAERAARTALVISRPATAETHFVLGDVLEDEGSYSEAETELRQSLALGKKASDKDTQASSLRDLIRCAVNLNKQSDAQQWFEALVALGAANFYDWYLYARRLDGLNKFRDSGAAYETGANLNGPYSYLCSAATEYAMAAEQDLVLSSARKCIELGIGQNGADEQLAVAHREIADVLNDRGVYSEALSHSKEATVLAPKDPFGFDSMGVALRGLHRPQEAIVAGEQAIVLSDGKFAFVLFNLGQAYFDTENWESARQSFQKAAELDLKEASAAYNVALCLQRQGFRSDAAHWYEEFLRRNPGASDRAEILDRIQRLRGAQ